MRKGTETTPHSVTPTELLASSAGWSQKWFASHPSAAKKWVKNHFANAELHAK